ncbi:MAG: prolipoprotein diacylglyceryl transferase, partial [Anaerolineae bacterium]|nr:prolipoprotein diacylglyceryl transferase [Anaerolineae bacterium]
FLDDKGIHIFALTLNWYGIIIVAAAWIAAVVARQLAKREGRDPRHVWRGLVWVSIGGLIGARLWFMLFPPESVAASGRTAGWFLTHFFDLNQGVLAAWSGGLGLFGGIIGGAVGLAIYTRRNQLPILPWLDIAAVALALGQAIGRWANGATQDLYGAVTHLPWGMLVDYEAQRVAPYTDLARFPLQTTRFHPLWLYESLWMVVVCAVLLVAFRRYRDRLLMGDITLVYLMLYSVARILIESIRVNVSRVGDVNISQTTAVILATAAILLLISRHRTSVLRPSGDVSHKMNPEQGA